MLTQVTRGMCGKLASFRCLENSPRHHGLQARILRKADSRAGPGRRLVVPTTPPSRGAISQTRPWHQSRDDTDAPFRPVLTMDGSLAEPMLQSDMTPMNAAIAANS